MPQDQNGTPPSSQTPLSSVPNSTSTTRTSTPAPIMNGEDLAAKKTAPDGKTVDETSKLRLFLSILKKFIGVTDIAAARFSLPAQLMEPVPNLEYWNYLDRPEAFAAIGDSDDDLGRMIGCLRFWFTKDLKYVKGKPCKPYNSALGEFFRCSWDVEPPSKSPDSEEEKVNGQISSTTANGDSVKTEKPVKVNYVTEQTSHHPPVSAFVYECPDKGIVARGYDQLSAKFTGTSVRVIAGQYNKGIFITLQHRDNEEYHLTHPAAYLGGFLRGNLNVTVADTCFVICAKTGIKVILHYLEEGYFGKTQNKVEGVIYKCDVGSDKIEKISDVPDDKVLGRIEGCWKDKVYMAHGSTPWKKIPDEDKILLVDLNPLYPATKNCPPEEEQLPNESRKFWADVTSAILTKQYSTATTKKQELEETQRQVANKRKADLKEWQPRFFKEVTEPGGRPNLSADGETALKGMNEEQYFLELPQEYGAML